MGTSERDYTVASFFSGCGGFDYGFHKSGFRILLANDSWEDARQTFVSNYPEVSFFLKPIQDLKVTEIKEKIGGQDIDVFVGGPPCQCFTRLNNRFLIKLSEQKKEDRRKELSEEYIKKVELLRPKIVLIENVKDMLIRKNSEGKLYTEIIEKEFEKIGYKCYYEIINMENYLVPQKRRRVIFFATRIKKLIRYFEQNPHKIFPRKSKRIMTVSEALEPIKNQTGLKNHKVTINDSLTLERIKHIPKGGYYNHLPDYLKTKRVIDGKEVTVKRYGSYFRRLHPEKPATTITKNYIIHPFDDRYLTNREKALIHTFPLNYKFKGTEESVSQQIANAVPPRFSIRIAKHIKQLLNKLEG